MTYDISSESDSDPVDDPLPFVDATGAMIREYQQKAIDEILKRLREGAKRIGLQAPTGSGKTVLMGKLVKALCLLLDKPQPKVLVIVPSSEIAQQVKRVMMEEEVPGYIGTEQGTFSALPQENILDRVQKFDPDSIDAIFLDETHHVGSPSYTRILKWFIPTLDVGPPHEDEDGSISEADEEEQPVVPQVEEENSRHSSCGIQRHTIPPSQGQVFGRFLRAFPSEDRIKLISCRDLIEQGYLSPFVLITVDLSPVDPSPADPPSTKRKRKSKTPEGMPEATKPTFIDPDTGYNDGVVECCMHWGADRKTILCFANNVDHAEKLTEAFKAKDIGSIGNIEALCGNTNKRRRVKIIDDFRSGKLRILVTCKLLHEGVDIPPIDCLVIAQATTSCKLITQMVGRGFRPSPGKKDCLVLDFTQSKKTGVWIVPELSEAAYKEETPQDGSPVYL